MRKYTPAEYEELVQDTFPNLKLTGEYTGLANKVSMSCSRCGGNFMRVAQSNLSRDCPICFEVYSNMYGGPPGFYDTIKGVTDIRQLGAGNMDQHLTTPDITPQELAKKMTGGMFVDLMTIKENKHDNKLEKILTSALKKHGIH